MCNLRHCKSVQVALICHLTVCRNTHVSCCKNTVCPTHFYFQSPTAPTPNDAASSVRLTDASGVPHAASHTTCQARMSSLPVDNHHNRPHLPAPCPLQPHLRRHQCRVAQMVPVRHTSRASTLTLKRKSTLSFDPANGHHNHPCHPHHKSSVHRNHTVAEDSPATPSCDEAETPRACRQDPP